MRPSGFATTGRTPTDDRKPSVVKQYKDLEPGDVCLALGIPNDPEHAWTTAPNVHGETDGFGRDSSTECVVVGHKDLPKPWPQKSAKIIVFHKGAGEGRPIPDGSIGFLRGG